MSRPALPIWRRLACALLASAAVTGAGFTAQAQEVSQAESPATRPTWPEGQSPEAVGRRVAERYVGDLRRYYERERGREVTPEVEQRRERRGGMWYAEACTWYGSLTFAEAAGEAELAKALDALFDPILGDFDWRVPEPNHVDHTVFAIVPFEIAMQSDSAEARVLAVSMADAQWELDANASDEERRWLTQGYTPQTRLWIDDMYMITVIQVQAYRATGEQQYLDRAAKEMVLYLDELQQPNGLFFHGQNAEFFWGRGNGWVAAGLAELLRDLPEGHEHHARVLEGYQRMMEALLSYQGDDGMWRQLIDRPESWKETSCTGMFTFAFIEGVRQGWLDEPTYGPAARKGWLGLVSYLDDDAAIRDVCVGTGKSDQYAHYMERPRSTGDLHGQAPVLWCATAWLRDDAAE